MRNGMKCAMETKTQFKLTEIELTTAAPSAATTKYANALNKKKFQRQNRKGISGLNSKSTLKTARTRLIKIECSFSLSSLIFTHNEYSQPRCKAALNNKHFLMR